MDIFWSYSPEEVHAANQDDTSRASHHPAVMRNRLLTTILQDKKRILLAYDADHGYYVRMQVRTDLLGLPVEWVMECWEAPILNATDSQVRELAAYTALAAAFEHNRGEADWEVSFGNDLRGIFEDYYPIGGQAVLYRILCETKKHRDDAENSSSAMQGAGFSQ